MRTPALLFAALLACGACQREPVVETPPTPPAAAPATLEVEGWTTSEGSFPLLHQTAPAFSAPMHGGGEATLDRLRGKWTILAFWGLWSDDSLADTRYISALISAAGQDPGLEVLTIHTPPGPGRGAEALGDFRSLSAWFADQGGAPWPTVLDDNGAVAEAFRVTEAPVYLLVGPDLTIEAWRTDLSATPDDGIKSVIRGVADIRKEVAAPE